MLLYLLLLLNSLESSSVFGFFMPSLIFTFFFTLFLCYFSFDVWFSVCASFLLVSASAWVYLLFFFLFAAVPYVVFLLESLLSVSSISTLISIILTKPHWIFCWIILNSSSICCDGVMFRYCDRCTVCIASSMLPSRLPKLSLRLHRVLFCEHYRDLILPASLFV